MQTPSGRLLDKFRGSVDTAVALATGLADDDPAKMELLQALHRHLCILRENVKDNMNVILACDLLDLHTRHGDMESI